jgi:hypothetical protein
MGARATRDKPAFTGYAKYRGRSTLLKLQPLANPSGRP